MVSGPGYYKPGRLSFMERKLSESGMKEGIDLLLIIKQVKVNTTFVERSCPSQIDNFILDSE